MFDKFKQLMDVQRKMKEVKQELEKTNFEITSPDGLLRIAMNGSQEILGVSIDADLASIDKKRLETSLKDGYNKAIKRSHEIAASKMKDVTGLNLPGL